MSIRKYIDPIFIPFLGILPILDGAYNVATTHTACSNSPAELCQLQGLAGVMYIGFGILWSILSGIIVGLVLRKKIIWRNWLIVWGLYIVVSSVIVAAGFWFG